ncbi:MAG: CHASE domain-containing protein, partial [Verrucomicrobiota bacterium]
MTSNRKSQWPVFFGAAVLVAGAALSVTISAMSASNVREKNRRAFVRKAESFRDAVRRELHLEIEVLESIRSLHGLSEQISPEQFEEFLQKGMAYQRRILQGFGFVQRMNHRERLLREASGDSEYALKFKVLDVSSDGEILPAPRRPVYFPLTYQTPEKALGVPVGYDFGGRTACRRAIETFETSESTVTGGKALDVVEGSRGSSKAVGYYVFSPILYAQIPGTPLKTREPGYLVGFAVGIIRPDELVNRAAERLPDAQLEASLARGQSGKQYGMAHEFTDVIRMAGADWFFACRPGPGFEQQADSFQPLLILLLGLTVTAFIGGEFLLVARRTKKVERDVQERTLQLREAKQKLEAENAERRRLEREIIEVGNREKLRVGQDLHDSLGQK